MTGSASNELFLCSSDFIGFPKEVSLSGFFRSRILRYWSAIALVLAGAVVVRHADPSVVARLRMLGFDTLQQAAPRTPDPKYPVRIVDADERSIMKLGSWPWDREIYARLLDTLGALGARAVAFRYRVCAR